MIKMLEIMDSKDSNIYSLDEMIKMYDQDELNYSFVSKRLCCPCCFSKEIIIKIDQEVAYIRSKRDSHEKGCDYYGLFVSQNFIKKQLKTGTGFELNLDLKIEEKYLPRKNIERLLTEDDFGVYKIFYGRVVLKSAYTKDKTKYLNYSFKSKRGDVISFTIKSNLYPRTIELVQQLNDSIDKEINIMMLGIINEVEAYNNFILEHDKMIIIK